MSSNILDIPKLVLFHILYLLGVDVSLETDFGCAILYLNFVGTFRERFPVPVAMGSAVTRTREV